MPDQGNDGGTEQSSPAPEPNKIEIIPLEPKKITKRNDDKPTEKRTR